MLDLLGYGRLNKQLLKLSRFQQNVNAHMKGRESNYRNRAKDIVRLVVYSYPPNPLYPRSKNLLAAVDVNTIKDLGGSSVSTYIFLNPNRASRDFAYQYRGPAGPVQPQGLLSFWNLTGQGGFLFYPSYVRRGVFFKRKMPPRDFVATWRATMAPTYVKDVAKAIRKI